MGRVLAFVYGLVAYVVFFLTFLYAIGFVGNLVVPKSIDVGGPSASLGAALAVNLGLLALFAIQHSGMARQGFKEWWTKIIPKPIERSTYVLLSSLVLILLFWQWRPMTGEVWSVEAPAGRAVLQGLFWLGWAVVLLATFMISHSDLFGLKQVFTHLTERSYEPPKFQVAGFYRVIRHPLLAGFIVAFWATPEMTTGHLLFAVATTGYMLLAIPLEERDLVRFHGEKYREYREATPALIPIPGGGAGGAPEEERRPEPREVAAEATDAPGSTDRGEADAGPERDAPARDAAERDAAERDAAERDAAERDAAERDAARGGERPTRPEDLGG